MRRGLQGDADVAACQATGHVDILAVFQIDIVRHAAGGRIVGHGDGALHTEDFVIGVSDVVAAVDATAEIPGTVVGNAASVDGQRRILSAFDNAIPDTAAVLIGLVAGDGTRFERQFAVVANAAATVPGSHVPADGDAGEGSRGAIIIEQAASARRIPFMDLDIIAGVSYDGAARHGQRSAAYIADAATPIISHVAPDGNIRQGRRALVEHAAAVAAPATGHGTVHQFERPVAFHDDDLAATGVTAAVQREAAQVDVHGLTAGNLDKITDCYIISEQDIGLIRLHRRRQFALVVDHDRRKEFDRNHVIGGRFQFDAVFVQAVELVPHRRPQGHRLVRDGRDGHEDFTGGRLGRHRDDFIGQGDGQGRSGEQLRGVLRIHQAERHDGLPGLETGLRGGNRGFIQGGNGDARRGIIAMLRDIVQGPLLVIVIGTQEFEPKLISHFRGFADRTGKRRGLPSHRSLEHAQSDVAVENTHLLPHSPGGFEFQPIERQGLGVRPVSLDGGNVQRIGRPAELRARILLLDAGEKQNAECQQIKNSFHSHSSFYLPLHKLRISVGSSATRTDYRLVNDVESGRCGGNVCLLQNRFSVH